MPFVGYRAWTKHWKKVVGGRSSASTSQTEMKRLLFAATVLLSTARCDVNATKITDSLMTSSRSDRGTATSNGDFSEKQVWWKREKRKNGGQRIASNDDALFSPASLLFARYFDANGRRSQQEDSKKPTGMEYPRYRNANPQSYLVLCDPRNKCANRRQDWQIQKPFYVDEPSWIEIDEDYAENHPIHRLKLADPFVISRGKRIRGVGRSKDECKRHNFDAFAKNHFADENGVSEPRLELKNDRRYDDNERFSDLQRTNERSHFQSSDKMDDRRFGDGNSFERPKSKRFESSLDSDTDLDSNPAIDGSAAKEILERLMENLECDSKRCADHFGRTSKRTRLGDGRGMLEDLLTKSDPFYVARGKRIPSVFDFSSKTNDSPSRESTIHIDSDRNL